MLSIIIPTYGNWARIKKLIASIHRFEKDLVQIIVVNDKPAEQYKLEHHPHYRVIQNEANLGFAKSVNRGLEQATGDILLLCNDDIVFTKPVFKLIEKEFAADPTLGILGALLKYPGPPLGTGGIQHAGMVFDARTKSFLHIKKNPKTQYMIAVTGAFFAISKKYYDFYGGLDAQFFLACEDTAYCIDAWYNDWKVKFSAEISAIHEEGATRGRTTQQKAKFKEWTSKEAKGITDFKNQLDLNLIAGIATKVMEANIGGPLKIELGSGYNPHPGYKHLDIRAGLPQLDYVCDFMKEKLPFKDGSVEEILANHVIEHISFRKLPFVIGEWARVLKPEGKLILRTPNLKFICQMYLDGKTTPEWPADEKFIRDNLNPEVTPAWWANIKLFSGQDYAANFHHCCFDFEMLSDLLKRHGFGITMLAKFEKTFSPGELQVEAYKSKPLNMERLTRFYDEIKAAESNHIEIEAAPAKEFKLTNFTYPSLPGEFDLPSTKAKKGSCLVIRSGAMGDVLLTTPIIERLAKEYETIHVCTKVQGLFEFNPHIKRRIDPTELSAEVTQAFDRVINLNNAYELRPKMHIIDAYSEVAFGDHNTPLKTSLGYRKLPKKEDYICIHASVGWENRTWDKEKWYTLLAELKIQGEELVVIGKGSDYDFENWPLSAPVPNLNYVNKQSLWEMVDTIAGARLFIGMDSGPLHVAEACGTPAIGLYTCALPKYRSTSSSTIPITPGLDCEGCLHDVRPPVNYVGCHRDDFQCLEEITVLKVMKAYEQYFKRETPRGDKQQHSIDSP